MSNNPLPALTAGTVKLLTRLTAPGASLEGQRRDVGRKWVYVLRYVVVERVEVPGTKKRATRERTATTTVTENMVARLTRARLLHGRANSVSATTIAFTPTEWAEPALAEYRTREQQRRKDRKVKVAHAG
jgi:hypothetical protein